MTAVSQLMFAAWVAPKANAARVRVRSLRVILSQLSGVCTCSAGVIPEDWLYTSITLGGGKCYLEEAWKFGGLEVWFSGRGVAPHPAFLL